MLHGSETWAFTLGEKRRINVFENRIPKRIFGTKRMRMGSGEGFTLRNIIICNIQIIKSGWLNREDEDGQAM